MPITGPDSRLYVVVGILSNSRDQFLIQQRLAGKPCAGQWEFPGGKLEEGETPVQGLKRELLEELGVDIEGLSPLIQLPHDYAHANVWLDVYLSTGFNREVTGREGQQFAWKKIDEIRRMDVLEAVSPILDELESRYSHLPVT
jgi:8-oxo-dGTP diphosphatase